MQQNQNLDCQLNYIPFRYRHRSHTRKKFSLRPVETKQYSINKKKSNPEKNIQYVPEQKQHYIDSMNKRLENTAKEMTKEILSIFHNKQQQKLHKNARNMKDYKISPQNNKNGQNKMDIDFNQDDYDYKLDAEIAGNTQVHNYDSKVNYNRFQQQQKKKSHKRLEYSQVFNNSDLEQMKKMLLSNIKEDKQQQQQFQFHKLSFQSKNDEISEKSIEQIYSDPQRDENDIKQINLNAQLQANDNIYERQTQKKQKNHIQIDYKQSNWNFKIDKKEVQIQQENFVYQSYQNKNKYQRKIEDQIKSKNQGYSNTNIFNKFKRNPPPKIEHFIGKKQAKEEEKIKKQYQTISIKDQIELNLLVENTNLIITKENFTYEQQQKIVSANQNQNQRTYEVNQYSQQSENEPLGLESDMNKPENNKDLVYVNHMDINKINTKSLSQITKGYGYTSSLSTKQSLYQYSNKLNHKNSLKTLSKVKSKTNIKFQSDCKEAIKADNADLSGKNWKKVKNEQKPAEYIQKNTSQADHERNSFNDPPKITLISDYNSASNQNIDFQLQKQINNQQYYLNEQKKVQPAQKQKQIQVEDEFLQQRQFKRQIQSLISQNKYNQQIQNTKEEYKKDKKQEEDILKVTQSNYFEKYYQEDSKSDIKYENQQQRQQLNQQIIYLNSQRSQHYDIYIQKRELKQQQNDQLDDNASKSQKSQDNHKQPTQIIRKQIQNIDQDQMRPFVFAFDQIQMKNEIQCIIKSNQFKNKSSSVKQHQKSQEQSSFIIRNQGKNDHIFNLEDVLEDFSYIKQNQKHFHQIFQPQFNDNLFGKDNSVQQNSKEKQIYEKNLEDFGENYSHDFNFRGKKVIKERIDSGEEVFRGNIKTHLNPKKQALRKYRHSKTNSADFNQKSLVSMRNNSLSINKRDSVSILSGKSKKDRKQSNLIRFNTRLNKNL